MGEIYVAEDTVLGREVAVKLLDDRFGRDEQVRARFTREALTAAKLSGHPNIVTIFDVGEHEGRPFIVMEYLRGGTIADRARTGAVEPKDALGWLAQAASALDEAHTTGVVHRDIKPANLLLDERGNVHVADFGIARVADESAATMTAAGTILGTAGYLSPEQARGEPATSASDVYALGIVAYELLTGARPFEGGSATAEAAAHMNQAVPYASERGAGLPPAVDGVFARVLAKRPDARHARASDFVEELQGVLGRAEETTKVAPPAVLPAPAPSRAERSRPVTARGGSSPRWLPALIGGLVLAALAAGGVLAAVMSSNDEEPQGAEARTITRETTVEGDPTTVTETTAAESEPESTEPDQNTSGSSGNGLVSYDEAVALTDESTALMADGNYAEALPLARRAYRSLRGSGELYEAYAAYNTGKSYIELGDCNKGLRFLDASEAIQGARSEIDAARAQCLGDEEGDD